MGSSKDKKMSTNCVCDILLSIVEAQDQVQDDCANSCNASIQELVGGVNTQFNTIPVILTCDCELFVGTGVRRDPDNMQNLEVLTAVVFRVNDVDPETCCATLELLQEGTSLSPNDLLGDVDDLVATNTCITVDLNCFCAVTCLPPQAL